VCSDGKEIPTHRFVLVAHSPVMYKMLMAPMLESKTHTAKLDDIDGETMLEVLRFLYTGKVEDVDFLAPSLLYCAEKYELKDLKNYAATSMSKNLTLDNVLEYFTLADRYEEENLLAKCLFHIKQ
jgi:speckle-type POZ protein